MIQLLVPLAKINILVTYKDIYDLFHRALHSLSKADSVVAHIKLCVELADEDVTEDPLNIHLRRKVHPHEAGDALSLTLLSYGQNVVPAVQSEGLAVEHEVNVWHRVEGVAVDEILSSARDQLHSSNLSVNGADFLHRPHQQARASVHDAGAA